MELEDINEKFDRAERHIKQIAIGYFAKGYRYGIDKVSVDEAVEFLYFIDLPNYKIKELFVKVLNIGRD